ncbi:hypothetical protein EBT31_13825 [bacterium]|jgi:hypothetical protein|nr:hypothetical protein [bacterium]
MSETMDFAEWVKIGITNGWCGAPVCSTHDGIPQSKAEDDQWEEGEDPCIHVIRLYWDKDEQKAVEENHAPSVWRDHYTR